MSLENENTEQQPITDESQLSVEQKIELEKLRTERAQAEAKTAELRARNSELESQTNWLKLRSQLGQAIDASELKFMPDLDKLQVLAQYKCGVEFSVAADGKLVAHANGTSMAPIDALKKVAVEFPELVNKTSKGWKTLQLEPGRGVMARSDLQNAEDRIEFINRFGLPAFENLPSRRIDKTDLGTLTQEEYKSLGTREKTEIIDRIGMDGVEAILCRKARKG